MLMVAVIDILPTPDVPAEIRYLRPESGKPAEALLLLE